MASILKVDTIQDQSGNNIINESGDTITIGASGDTITIPSGATLTVPNGGLSGQNYPAFFASLTSNQNIGNASLVKIQLNSVTIDTDSAFDNVTNYRFTVPSGKGGIYYVAHQIGAFGYTAPRTISVPYKNGGGIAEYESFNSSASYNHSGNSFIISLNDGDYLELYGYQNSGGTAAIRGNAAQYMTYLSAFRIGD